MNDREMHDRLKKVGWSQWNIYQLERLRRQYLAEQDSRESVAQERRLQFLRWLVTTGKLTEQVA